MSPIKTIKDVKPGISTFTMVSKMIDTDSKTLLEKFQLIEKGCAAGEFTLNEALKLVVVAIRSESKGDVRFTKILAALAAVIKALAIPVKPSKPVLSSTGEYVEMGDGLKWATCNLGASKPEESGDYYAWGETELHYSSLSPLTWKTGKERGYWDQTYEFSKTLENNSSVFIKYNEQDGKTSLDPADDVAKVKLKGNWRIPSAADWERLMNKDNFTWTLYDDGKICGYIVTSKVKGYEGNKIFLPAASDFMCEVLRFKGRLVVRGSYWTSEMVPGIKYYNVAKYLCLTDSFMGVCGILRYMGLTVRPVSN